jgi:Family of unknown function (DUF5681)
MSGEYKVGYKKPPRSGQFRKGRSGNPKGRPKKAKQDMSDITAILSEPVAVNKSGIAQLMSPFEASIRTLVGQALNGRNVNAALELVRLCESYGVVVSLPAPDYDSQVLIVPRNFTIDEFSEMNEKRGRPPWPGDRSGLRE